MFLVLKIEICQTTGIRSEAVPGEGSALHAIPHAGSELHDQISCSFQ